MKGWFSLLTLIAALVFWSVPVEAGFAAESQFVTEPQVFAESQFVAESPILTETTTENNSSLFGQNFDADAISAEKISQFVQVYLQVLQFIEQRQNELQGAETESESQQIQREIEAQAVDLIQASGLTLQEYLQLLSLTNIDPEFGERVAAQLQEAID